MSGLRGRTRAYRTAGGWRPAQSGYGHRVQGSGRCRRYRCAGYVDFAVGLVLRSRMVASSAAPCARRSEGVPDHRGHVRHGRVPGPAIPAVHRVVPSVRSRLRLDHGLCAVHRRQRLPVHPRSARHQRFQVRWSARLHEVQRAVRR